jgi:hypothetical protein
MNRITLYRATNCCGATRKRDRDRQTHHNRQQDRLNRNAGAEDCPSELPR